LSFFNFFIKSTNEVKENLVRAKSNGKYTLVAGAFS